METYFQQKGWDNAATSLLHVETYFQQKGWDNAVTFDLVHVETYFQQNGWDNAATFLLRKFSLNQGHHNLKWKETIVSMTSMQYRIISKSAYAMPSLQTVS